MVGLFSLYLSYGQKAFDMIPTRKKIVFDKKGLGYKSSIIKKYFKMFFVKESTSQSPSIVCNFCGRERPISSTCPLRNGS